MNVCLIIDHDIMLPLLLAVRITHDSRLLLRQTDSNYSSFLASLRKLKPGLHLIYEEEENGKLSAEY